MQLLQSANYPPPTTDPLTGLYNHRILQETIVQEIQRARKTGHPFSIVLVDIYNFHLLNETHGYHKGDTLLVVVAKLLLSLSRQQDTVGRYGGDEFLLILPDTDSSNAFKLAEKVISSASRIKFKIAPDKSIPLELIIGIASFPEDCSTRQELTALAEKALSEAKTQGANTIRLASQEICDVYAYHDKCFGILHSLIIAIDAKDHYTKQHSENVAYYALELARELKLPLPDQKKLYFAGLFHDIGKIGIPEHILRKPDTLTDQEYEIIKQHPKLSKIILAEIPQFKDILDIVLYHHERLDGTGYPEGLKGPKIPCLARLIAVIDTFSALTVDRPYHKALPPDQAIAILEKAAGSQLDPELTRAFTRMIADLSQQEKPLTCWQYKNCDKYKCPLYHNQKLGHICWLIRDILYHDVDEKFTNKRSFCSKCSFYKQITSNRKGRKQQKTT